jgi:hypothetical protein
MTHTCHGVAVIVVARCAEWWARRRQIRSGHNLILPAEGGGEERKGMAGPRWRFVEEERGEVSWRWEAERGETEG